MYVDSWSLYCNDQGGRYTEQDTVVWGYCRYILLLLVDCFLHTDMEWNAMGSECVRRHIDF